jgi:putative inorganic carbon (HCO3(-)) transporter
MKLPVSMPALGGPPGFGPLRRPSEPAQYLALIVASSVAATLLTLIAYRLSPVVAVAMPAAVAVVAAVFWRPFLGVAMAMLAIPLERIAVPAGAAAELTPAKALLLLVAGAVAVRWVMGAEHLRMHRVWLPFAGLLAVMALGIGFAPEPFVVVKVTFQWTAFLIVAVLVGGASRRELEQVFMAVAIAGGVLGAIAATTSGQQSLVAGGEAATGRAQAGFEHPAVLAFFLVLAFGPAVALTMSGSRPGLRPIWAGCAALCAAGIAFSLTRGAMVALAVSLTVLLLLPAFRRWAAVLFVGLVVFAAANFNAIQNSPQLEVIGQRLSTVTKATESTSSNQRPYIWSKTPLMIIDHPFFGVGAANYPFYAPRYAIVGWGGSPYVHAHNVPLTIAAENGLIGLGFLLWFGGGVVALGTSAVLRYKSSPHYPFAVAGAASIAGAFLTGMIDYPPGTVVIMGASLVLIGALVAAERLVREEPEPAAATP